MRKWMIMNFNLTSNLGMLLYLLAFSAFYLFFNPFTILSKDLQKEIRTTQELLDHIVQTRSNSHLRAFTFIQNTVRYSKEGQVLDTTLWYEAIRYPKDFRIDFGNPDNGNANINRNDSIYVYRGHKMVHKGPEIQEFLILEGGLFYYGVKETLARLEQLGIRTDHFTIDRYNGRQVYIIGGDKSDTSQPQIWVDAEHFYVVRRFSRGKQGELYEVRYDDFKNIDGHWVESWIEFWQGDTLIQTERYTNINVHPQLNDAVFDPSKFGEVYWFK